tara:strand:- start:297 stop:674 length:378 start_codon:yes stop_codon:yes gene_type:complete
MKIDSEVKMMNDKELVAEWWATFYWQIDARANWERAYLEKHDEIIEYCAVNFIEVTTPKGGIKKCDFMNMSYQLGYLKKRSSREYVVVTGICKHPPCVMRIVLQEMAKKITADSQCHGYHVELLT